MSGSQLSRAGFVILYDFVTGLPNEIACAQLSVALHAVSKGTGHYGQPVFLDSVYTVPVNNAQMLRIAYIGAKQPVTHCLPDTNTCLVVELLTSSAYGTPVTRAWTKVDLFDSKSQLLSGSWRIPFYDLPIMPDADISSLSTFGVVEVFVRLTVSTASSVIAANASPTESYLPSPRQLGRKPEKTEKQQITKPVYESTVVGERHTALTIQIDRIKGGDPIRCRLRLTAYHQHTGEVMRSLASDPIVCKSSIVDSTHRHHYLVFGQQERTFTGIRLEGDELLVARLYMITHNFHKKQDYDDLQLISSHVEEQEEDVGEVLVAWGALKLCASHKKGQQKLQDVHLNVGIHPVALFCPPVPEIQLIEKRGIDNGPRYHNASLRLKIISGAPQPGSLTPSEDSDDQDFPEEAWILHKRPSPPSEPFTATDGFDLYIDGCRFLPENVSVTRVSGSVLDKRYSKVGRAMSCIAKLDSDVHNPVYGFRVEFREPAIPPTSTLIIKVYTVEPESGSSVIIGYALLNIFVETGSKKQPIADAGMQVSLNEGAHQLRLYTEGPEGNEPMTATCIVNKRHVPCATILIRIVKATLGPLGKPLEADKVPHADWFKLGLFHPLPSYADHVYYSSSCHPSKGERLMLCAMQNRTPVTIREVLKDSAADAKDLKRHQTNAELEAYLQKRFNDIMDKIPVNYDLTFIVPFSPKHGIKLSVDHAKNIPWKHFSAAILSCNPPASFYKKEPRTVFDKPVFVHSLNLLSTNKDPIWDDGFAHFTYRSYHEFLTIIIHLKEIEMKMTQAGYRYSLRDEAWTAMQVFNGKFVNTSYYQLPLIDGSPSAADLQELETEPFREWIAKGVKSNKVRLVADASVLIRLCDGRRDDELPPGLPDGVQTKCDLSYLPVNTRSGYLKNGHGKQLLSMIPEGKTPEEFSTDFANHFKQIVYKLHVEATDD